MQVSVLLYQQNSLLFVCLAETICLRTQTTLSHTMHALERCYPFSVLVNSSPLAENNLPITMSS